MTGTPTTTYETPLPPSVRAQVDRANQLLAEQQQAREGAPVVTGNDPPPQEHQPQPPQQQPPSHPGTVPPPQPQPQPQQPPQQPPQQAPPVNDLQHRYDTLQGRYNADVGRLRDANRQLGERLENMERVLGSMQLSQPPEPQQQQVARNGHAPPASQQVAPEDAITPQEVEEYGPELLDLIERKARQIARQMVAPVQQSVQHVVTNVQQNTEQSLKAQVFTALDRWDNGWQHQNNDPAFLHWLDALDHYSGQTRGLLLQDAFAKGDARRVIGIFDGFRKETGAITPQPQSAPPSVPTGQRPTLDTFAAPNRGVASPAPTGPNQGRIWRQSDIKRFFDAKVRGHYNGRDAEALQLEQDIFRAQAEGRVVPG